MVVPVLERDFDADIPARSQPASYWSHSTGLLVLLIQLVIRWICYHAFYHLGRHPLKLVVQPAGLSFCYAGPPLFLAVRRSRRRSVTRCFGRSFLLLLWVGGSCSGCPSVTWTARWSPKYKRIWRSIPFALFGFVSLWPMTNYWFTQDWYEIVQFNSSYF